MDKSRQPPPGATTFHLKWKMTGSMTAPGLILAPSVPRDLGPSTDYFFSPNGNGLSGVLAAFFLPAFSKASRVRVSTVS